MTTLYKTLFDVKLLHEFYLTENNNETVFDLELQSARMSFLQQKFQENTASISRDLLFTLHPSIQSVFDNLHLRLLATYSGFTIAVEVQDRSLEDGTRVYIPKVPLPGDLNMAVLIVKKNSSFDCNSNARLLKSMSSVNYFTNDNITGARTFPFLSAELPAFDASVVYEQGELATHGLNDIRQFYNDGIAGQWQPVNGKSFVNSNDRFVVSPVFNYAFDIEENITEANFILKDNTGNIFKTIEVKNEHPFGSFALNFNPGPKEKKLISLPANAVTDKSIYLLEVILNSTIVRRHSIIFWDNDIEFNNYWGIVNIKPQVADGDFNLLDENGFIKTRRTPTGERVPAPVFEICIKSRLTYWRYKNNKQGKLKISADTIDFLDLAGINLVSKKPRSASYQATSIKKDLDNSYHLLPNPDLPPIISRENGRLFSDISVPESKMFPVAT